MRHSKFGLRAFGLAILAALGLMAFTAVAAQAENLGDGGKAGIFLVEGSGPLSIGRKFTGQQEKWTDGILHGFLLVEGRNLSILCVKADVLEGKVLKEAEALAKVTFLECTASNFKATEKLPCTIPKGEITATALILPKLHAPKVGEKSELYLLFEGDPTTSPFTTVTFEGAECPLPKTNTITGSVVALIKEGATAHVVNLIIFNEEIQLLFQEREGGVPTGKFLKGDRLLFGTFDSYVESNANVEINDETHKGKVWSVI